ncbi:MAG: hypothetical protein NTY74_04800 [Ignavibacteriae bacterium]|nr:hypothetical protein [Ignavibacteriota bacterium]
MKGLGLILILFGIIGVIYFQTSFDTSVSVNYIGKVNNLGLMNDKLIFTIISLASILFGIILYIAGNRSINNDDYDEDDSEYTPKKSLSERIKEEEDKLKSKH